MKNLISIQTGDWLDNVYGGIAGADAAFAYIKSLGFEGLDLNMDHDWRPNQIRKGENNGYFDASVEEILERYRPVKEASEKHGIPIVMAHGIFPLYSDADPSLDEYLWMAIEKQLAVCRYLSCPALVVHPIARGDRTEEKEMNLRMYRTLMPAGKRYGVKICLENMFNFAGGHAIRRACASIEEACWYIDTLNAEAGEELFGFCYDVGHANILSNNIYEDLKLLGKRLTTLHIHENDGRQDLHMLPFAYLGASQNSTTDWEGFLRGLREIGYEGPLNFETYASTVKVPQPMIRPLHTLTYEVGKYFRNEINK